MRTDARRIDWRTWTQLLLGSKQRLGVQQRYGKIVPLAKTTAGYNFWSRAMLAMSAALKKQ
jgi:hypothetical protein